MFSKMAHLEKQEEEEEKDTIKLVIAENFETRGSATQGVIRPN